MRIFLSAGERSGDAHAAALARALREACPDLSLAGIGGPAMAAAGVELAHRMDDLQAVGLVEAARTLPAHVRALRAARRVFRTAPCDLLIAVDYPGFHAVLAGTARRHGVPVAQYIAPQFWAWGGWRIPGFRRRVRHTMVILPFEEPFFRAHGVPATFVGHPSLDVALPSRDAARASLGIGASAPVLGLFPGSRPSERRALWPLFHAAAARLRGQDAGLEVVVAADDPSELPGIATLGARAVPAGVAAAAANVALAKSGTTTLELALAGTPHVVAYRVHPLTVAVARRVLRVRWIGLVNLVLERAAVPELLQERATATALAEAAAPLFDASGAAARAQRAAFAEVAERLGPPGASRRAASLALELAA